MKKILSIVLCCLMCAGCIAYPAAHSIPRLEGRVVYYTNCILPDGTHLNKGVAITNVPLCMQYSVQQWTSQWVVGPRVETRKSYLYYTFTDEQGHFAIPKQMTVYWASRSHGSRTRVSEPMLMFLFPNSYVTIVDTNGPNAYRLIYPNDEDKPGKLETYRATGKPVKQGDAVKMEAFLNKIKTPANQAAQATAPAVADPGR